jgi:acyl-CoA hydrolase
MTTVLEKLVNTLCDNDPGRCAEAIVDRVGRDLLLAAPIGIGKPNLLVNALYRLAESDRRVGLKVFTGLTLVRPAYRSTLERRFVEPLLDRLFASYPEPFYVRAVREGTLPRNIEVHEFFFQAGAFMSVPLAQQNYVSMSYSHVAEHLQRIGTNVMAQLVAPHPDGVTPRLSLSSNPDVTLDMRPYIAARRRAGKPMVVAGEINSNLPYMPGHAEVDRSEFDVLLEPAGRHYDLFAPPKEPVPLGDYAMALHAATLIKDGGTLQIGIGSFADALAHVLILRHTRNADFRALLKAVCGETSPAAEVEPFHLGLYGCSEMLVDGFLHLRKSGILRRRVEGPPNDAGTAGRPAVVHAGFFLGCQNFYRMLREMPREDLDDICMTAISFTNELYGNERMKREQRRDARFVNTGLTATLLGAVSSDQLEDGRVISGVGGQHDFVAMAHALPDARSVIAVRSTSRRAGRLASNIVWRYGNTTVPRQLRDIIVTEYGIADLRGKSDRDVVVAMLKVADSSAQPQLQQAATAADKLDANFILPAETRMNSAERIRAALGPARRDGLLPQFPFGTEMTATEQSLIAPLGLLKSASHIDLARAVLAGASFAKPTSEESAGLQRMGLEAPRALGDRLLRAVLLGAMRRSRSS